MATQKHKTNTKIENRDNLVKKFQMHFLGISEWFYERLQKKNLIIWQCFSSAQTVPHDCVRNVLCKRTNYLSIH